MAAWSGDVLWPLISLWYKKDLIFIQYVASLSETFLCCMYCSFPKQAELCAQTSYKILDLCRAHLADSKLPGMDHLWCETVISLVPLWAHFWGQFSLSSHLWDGWDPFRGQSLHVLVRYRILWTYHSSDLYIPAGWIILHVVTSSNTVTASSEVDFLTSFWTPCSWWLKWYNGGNSIMVENPASFKLDSF